MNQIIPEQKEEQQIPKTQNKLCINKLCLSECFCSQIQSDFTPNDSNQIIYRGIIANNPNNPGFNLKEGVISYSKVQTIPLAQICKVKICYRNDFMLINTLQIYLANSENKPVCLGVSQEQASIWLYKVIEAKLAIENKISITYKRQTPQIIKGFIFKKSVFGKWKKHQATCSTVSPRYLKLQDEFFNINSTSQIWSRFQMTKQEGIDCLIIKLWGPFGKNQLAIPICQLFPWLKSIATLLS